LKTVSNCTNTTSIKDINDQFDYDDEKPRGKGDSELVACGQDGSYNELQYIYDSKLKPHVDAGDITEDQAIKALCSACHELKNPRTRKKFYEYLSTFLSVEIE
jgi:hypothetical protein